MPRLQTSVALAVAAGVDTSKALAAVTTVPAELAGISEQAGALVRGRDADICVWSGDPWGPAEQAAPRRPGWRNRLRGRVIMHTTPRFVVAALGAVLLASPLVAQDKAVAIRGAQVFTGKGAFQKNVTIVMSGGKIQAIGQGIAIPEGAETIDASGRWITPGLDDANTSLGLPSPHENEQSSEVTPHIPVRHAINPDAPDMKRALRAGVTTAYIAPGGLNVFGGIGCVYKTAGKSRMLKDESGTRMTLGNMPGQGNMPFRTFGTPASMYFRRPEQPHGCDLGGSSRFLRRDERKRDEHRSGPTAERGDQDLDRCAKTANASSARPRSAIRTSARRFASPMSSASRSSSTARSKPTRPSTISSQLASRSSLLPHRSAKAARVRRHTSTRSSS